MRPIWMFHTKELGLVLGEFDNPIFDPISLSIGLKYPYPHIEDHILPWINESFIACNF